MLLRLLRKALQSPMAGGSKSSMDSFFTGCTGRAVEVFLKQLCEGAVDIASSKSARTLSAAHL